MFLLFVNLAFSLLTSCNLSAVYLSIPELTRQLKLSREDIIERGKKEIKGFVDSRVWEGGYSEGDPLDKHGGSSYHVLMVYKGEILSPLYICFQECLKPNITSGTTVLEIGPGHGAWSKAILTLNPRSLICVDALSAEHNKFWHHVPNTGKTQYIQIHDFSLNEIKDDSLNFVFSFGTFCHISSLLCHEYLRNIYKKMKSGAHAFIMYADFYKKNRFAKKYQMLNHYTETGDELAFFKMQQETNNFAPTWYHLGIDRAQAVLADLGFVIVNVDININERDPIMHFYKP